jgi:hypothetical protein
VMQQWPRFVSFEEDFVLWLQQWKDKYGQKWVIFWDDTNVNVPDPSDADTNQACPHFTMEAVLQMMLSSYSCAAGWEARNFGVAQYLIQTTLPATGWHLHMSSRLCKRMCHWLPFSIPEHHG